MSHLALYTLGLPRVERDGAPLEIRRRRVMALLVYLAVTGRRHGRDTLATLFYPEHDQSQARAGLRRTLSTLRRTLGAGWLEVDLETVCLTGNAETASPAELAFWLDVAAFRELLAACRSHGHPPDQFCPACLPLLAEATALYRDDFLAGFTLRDSPGFDDWQSFQTQSLRDQLAGALERLAYGQGAQGRFEPAIADARRWVALDPLNEPAQRCLMHLYARSGQRAAALQQYADCEEALAKELHASPETDTQALAQAIQAGVALPPWLEQALAVVAAPAPAKHNLPVQLTPFVGRHALLAEIAARLADPACRLLTLVGPGGCGKTRLAIEAAARLPHAATRRLDVYTDGVYWVPLAGLDAPQAMTPAIAASLGFRFYTQGQDGASEGREPSTPRRQLLDYLRDKRLLLVLDNVEHLLSASDSTVVDLAGEVLRAAPGVQILATSRARLGVEFEHLLPISGMDCPDQDAGRDDATPADLGAYSAVRFFVQSARRTCPDFELGPDNQAAVASICRYVGGLPLAILLAATWMPALTPAEIALQLAPDRSSSPRRGLDFLQSDLRDLPERQRSIRAVFDGSWALLSPHERAVMQALSVFRGGFTQRAAHEVAGASLRDLAQLEQKSLLQRSAVDSTSLESWYQLHVLLRQYAAEQLAEDAGRSDTVRDAHCTYYAAALARWDAALKGPGQQSALAEMEREIENARTAWRWAIARRCVERLGQALDGLCRFYEWRVRLEDGVAACRVAADRLAGTADPDELRLLSRVRTWQSAQNQGLGKLQLAAQWARESLAILDREELAARDTRRERALALLQRGHLAHAVRDLQNAERFSASSKVLWEELGDRWSLALALYGLGQVAKARGAYERARALYEQSLATSRLLDDRKFVADTLMALGRVHAYIGRPEQAARLAQESLAIRRELGDRVALGHGLFGLGRILTGLGKYAEACELLEESLSLGRTLGDRVLLIESRRSLGFANVALGRHEVARAWLQPNLDLGRETHNSRMIANSLALLAPCALARGEHETALKMFRESVALFRKSGQRENLSWMLAGAACAELWLGQRHQAQRHLSQALHIVVQIRGWIAYFYALPVASLLLLKDGRVERALEMHAMLSRFPAFANSGFIEDQFGRQITAAAAGLPPERAAAARQRGRAMDPERAVAELLIELDVARVLPGPLGRLGRPLARLLQPVVALFVRRGS